MIKYETNEYIINESFTDIDINVDTTNIKIEPTNNDIVKVVCYEKRSKRHLCEVKDNTLIIKSKEIKWLINGFKHAVITLYLPKRNYTSMNIKVNTALVNITNLKVGELDIKTNTGKVNLLDIDCNNFHSKGCTGIINLNNLMSRESIKIKRNTGNVVLSKCDSKDIYIKTNTGKIELNLITNKSYITKSNVGKVITKNLNTDNTTVNGKCEIQTNTGNIVLN